MNIELDTKTTQPALIAAATSSDDGHLNLWKVGKVLEKITEQGSEIAKTFSILNVGITPFLLQSLPPRCSVQSFFISLCLLAGLQDE